MKTVWHQGMRFYNTYLTHSRFSRSEERLESCLERLLPRVLTGGYDATVHGVLQVPCPDAPGRGVCCGLGCDRDGDGGAKAILFASLAGSPDNLSFQDFTVVA